MNEVLYLKILYYIRENSGCVTLENLLIDLHHYLNLYCQHNYHSLLNLCAEGYISFLDKHKKDISKSICSMDYDELFDMFIHLHSLEKNPIFVQLTNKLFQIQSLFGFSLTDTIKKYSDPNSIVITPFFDIPDSTLKTDVFVIMPFQDNFNYIYNNYIKKVCLDINVSCIRADNLYSSKPIMQDIWSLIYNCKIIIADCTNKNPNVMYELGIAHTVGKQVLLITQDVYDIPFDLRHLRHLYYKYTPDAISTFEKDLKKALSIYFE